MVNKKSKAKKGTADTVNGVNGVAGPSVGAPSTSEAPQMPQPSSSTPSLAQKTPERLAESQEPEEDTKAQAEKIKEGGNVAFKAGKYRDAIDLYSRAIELNPSEPSYLTNRAASYMAIKKFRLALDDCQQAAALQSASPSPKTLLRLGRCQLALGSSAAALSTARTVLTIEPKNAAAIQLRDKVHVLEGHMRNFDGAKKRRDWGLARLALDKCFETIEAEGEEIPAEWRTWKVELELSRRNWDAANIAANDALRLNPHSPDILAVRGLVLFLGGKLPQSLQHLASALRLDPGHEGARLLRIRVKDIERLKEEGNIAFKSGRLQEAVDKYTEALDKTGDAEEEGGGGQIRATLLSNRATTSVKLGRHEEALMDTEASLALVPTSFKALRTRARINLHLEKFDAAVADFHSAIEQAGVEGSDADVRALKGELKKAEVALKRSKAKDYYKILGVSRECTELEIKKAYRRESLKHHPDKGGDEEKFKLVVEAHAVLSDPQRRARYDMGEEEDGSSSGMGGMGGMGGMNQADLAELFAQFNGGGFGGFGGGFPGGAYSSRGGGGRRGFSHDFAF